MLDLVEKHKHILNMLKEPKRTMSYLVLKQSKYENDNSHRYIRAC